jgi:glycosyltransferase involved in cell wall biosynthesis
MSLSVVIIAKNEQRCIGRCIKSFLPFVDDVVLADTGSHDATLSIAKNLGAKTISVAWRDDFSAARNLALDHSITTHNIVADADEWLISGGEYLIEIAKNKDFQVGQILIMNSFNVGDKIEHSSEWLSRIFPASIRYAGRIHEQPSHNLNIVKTDIVFGHDGYEDSQLINKIDRNEKLLRESLQKEPNNSYYLYQLGKELENKGDYDAAALFYRDALKLTQKDISYRHDLIIRSIFTFKHTKSFSEIFALASEMEYPESPDFFFVLGDALLDYALSNPSDANNILPLIEQSWKTCLELGERPNLPSTVLGRGSFLAAENLSVFYQTVGRIEEAKKYSNLAINFRANSKSFSNKKI